MNFLYFMKIRSFLEILDQVKHYLRTGKKDFLKILLTMNLIFLYFRRKWRQELVIRRNA